MLRHEVKSFLFVGMVTVLIDFCFYHVLIYLIQSYLISKAIGFIAGVLFSYFANNHITFMHRYVSRYGLWKFLVVYGITLFVNVTINSLMIRLLKGFNYSILIAFLIATVVSAILNFLGMRQFVFIGRKGR